MTGVATGRGRFVLLSAAGSTRGDGLPTVASRLVCHAFGFGGTTFRPGSSPADQANTVRRFGRAIQIELPGDPGPWKAATTESQVQNRRPSANYSLLI